MVCLSRKRIVITKDSPHGPGHSVAYQCSKVECEDHSAIQTPIICFDALLSGANLTTSLYAFLQFCRPTLSLGWTSWRLWTWSTRGWGRSLWRNRQRLNSKIFSSPEIRSTATATRAGCGTWPRTATTTTLAATATTTWVAATTTRRGDWKFWMFRPAQHRSASKTWDWRA